MKKEFLTGLLSLVIVLFIAGCVHVQTIYICSDGREVSNPGLCPREADESDDLSDEPDVVVPAPEDQEQEMEGEEEEEIVYEVDISDAAQELFDKSSNVLILYYVYKEPGKIIDEHLYYTSKEKMKITLKTRAIFADDEAYDTIYLDLVNKKAVGYCEDRDRQFCPDRDSPFNLDFEDYFVETPFDWIDKLNKAELTGRSQRIESRNAVEMDIEVKGVAGIMFVDSFFGVPLDITLGEDKFLFKDINVNLEKVTELDHQFDE